MASLKYVVLVLVLALALQVLLAQKRGRRRRLGAPKTPSNSGYRPHAQNNGYRSANNRYASNNGYGSNNGYQNQGSFWGDLSRSGSGSNGYYSNGYNSNGFNTNGYNSNGYNTNGYNSNGYNTNGYNSNRYNRRNRGRNNNGGSNSFFGGNRIFAAMLFGNDIPDRQMMAAQQNQCTVAGPSKHGTCNCCPRRLRCDVGFTQSRLYDECSPILDMIPCCSTVDAT